jgi:hypothetical protein
MSSALLVFCLSRGTGLRRSMMSSSANCVLSEADSDSCDEGSRARRTQHYEGSSPREKQSSTSDIDNQIRSCL